jgi:7-alpha-hydroxysteroid dehydrogenase
MSKFSLDGKVALVTGGGRGIGAGIARSFAEAGASVAVTARTAEQLDATAEQIRAAGGRALAIPADLADLAKLPGLIEQTVTELGGVDTLVNCAGGGDMWSPFLDTTVDALEEAFHFNVSVPFELARLCVPHMLERPGASIINIVSHAISLETRGHLAYDVSKGALLYATRAMAADLGPRIRVNGIHPGAVETEAMLAVIEHRPQIRDLLVEHTRLRRNGTPDDIGTAAVFLASPAASWITGKLIDVDGGTVGELSPMFPDL